MPGKQVAQGKAFEYACLLAVRERFEEEDVDFEIDESKTYIQTKVAYECLSSATQQRYLLAAKAAMRFIFLLEPCLIYDNRNIPITLMINADASAVGSNGDVRDVVCLRKASAWEIGISCKHNHEALRHPRLTESDKKGVPGNVADFGKSWFGYSCSNEYFQRMTTVMNLVRSKEGQPWKDAFEDKIQEVYVPALEAIKDEIVKLCSEHKDAPQKMLEYFFGSKDFYKVISLDTSKQTKIVVFNMYGTLNKPFGEHKPLKKTSKLPFPTRLIEARFKEKNTGEISKTTLALVFDKGWTITMRLHNADSNVKCTGLKFDVQLEGNPHGIYQHQQPWFE